jgi:hypothetical protein
MLRKNGTKTFVNYMEREPEHLMDQNCRFGQKEKKTERKKKGRWRNNLHPEARCCGRKIFKMIDNCQQM